ncbi:MAG: hypothetical protein KGI38_01035 [Thaumarchaeota archaeon]|nr:hypothetical protein [Nitrososphaerota archaeon]
MHLANRVAIGRVALGIVIILVIAVIAAAVVLSYPSSPGTTSASGSNGKMAVMGTDPYSSGSNSQEYVDYYQIQAHRTQAGGQSSTTTATTMSTTQSGSSAGWVKLNASGTLHLNTLVNASQTLALASISAGTYDAIRLYITSVTVTYNGQNYTAHMGSDMITASLTGNAQVTGSSTTVVLFDMRTVVINTGSSSSPQFVFTSSARVDVVASSDVSSTSLQVGARTDLSTSAWFQAFAHDNAHFEITAAAISSSSLSVTVKDSGAETANATLVIVTPASVLVGSQVVIPDSLQGSAVFVVGPSGSLTTVASGSILAQVMSPGSGLSVSSSSSATMTFSGVIQFGTAVALQTGVQAGQSYLITVIGTNSVASSTITAS